MMQKMTAQNPDVLVYEGRRRALCSNPLESYFEQHPPRPDWDAWCSACWRGYVATWAIVNERLLLAELRGQATAHAIASGTTFAGDLGRGDASVSLRTVFPEAQSPVLAEWYTGTLRIPDGELLEYVHAGYLSRYEREIVIEIERGRVVAERVEEAPAEWAAQRRREIAEAKRAQERNAALQKLETEQMEKIWTALFETLKSDWPASCPFGPELVVELSCENTLRDWVKTEFEEPSLMSKLRDLETSASDWAMNHADGISDEPQEEDGPALRSWRERFSKAPEEYEPEHRFNEFVDDDFWEATVAGFRALLERLRDRLREEPVMQIPWEDYEPELPG